MKEDTENFYSVEGFVGVYEINWEGNVRSVDRMVKDPKTGTKKFRRGRAVKSSMNAKGSPQVVLVKPDGKRYTVRVYTLMMEVFGGMQGGSVQAEKFISSDDNPGRGKIYEFVSPKGDYIKVQNLSKFCDEHKLHTSNMCQMHQGAIQSCKGWTKFRPKK